MGSFLSRENRCERRSSEATTGNKSGGKDKEKSGKEGISFNESVTQIKGVTVEQPGSKEESKLKDNSPESEEVQFGEKRKQHYESNYIPYNEGKKIAQNTMSGKIPDEVNQEKSEIERERSPSIVAFRELRTKVEVDESGNEKQFSEFGHSDAPTGSDQFNQKRKQHYETYMKLEVARKLADQAMDEKTEGLSCTPDTELEKDNSGTTDTDSLKDQNTRAQALRSSLFQRKESMISFKETVEKFHVSDSDALVVDTEPVKDTETKTSSSSQFNAKRKEHYDDYMNLEDARKLAEEALSDATSEILNDEKGQSEGECDL